MPRAVRIALRLKTGDELVYSIEAETVVISRAIAQQFLDLFATFTECDSEADWKVYADF